MAGGGAALSRVSSRGRLAAPYPTVPYSTVPYCVLPYSRNIRQSISYPVSLKESQGERKPLWETGENVENSVESVWKTCFKALRLLRAGAAGSLMGTFGRVRSGGGAAVDRSGARGRGCGGADAGTGGGRARRSMGACRQGGCAGAVLACGRVRSGARFWSGSVWRALSAGAGEVDTFGWHVVAAVRCGARVQRRARWLAFLQREKMLDKLCKSILNWKQGITQAAAGDGLRHRPHRRSCSVYPTSTSSVAAWPPRHLPRIAKGDARSHPRRALPPRTPPRVCASHVHLIRRGDFGHVLCVRRAPYRRCPPQNGDEKLRPASNRCWAEFCDSSRVGAAAFLWAFRRPFRWLFCAAAFPQPFLCACGHRAAFLTRPSRSCPRATPRTGCAYGRSGGRTPSSPATTAGRTR